MADDSLFALIADYLLSANYSLFALSADYPLFADYSLSADYPLFADTTPWHCSDGHLLVEVSSTCFATHVQPQSTCTDVVADLYCKTTTHQTKLPANSESIPIPNSRKKLPARSGFISTAEDSSQQVAGPSPIAGKGFFPPP